VITVLIAMYRAIPFRPHCRPSGHTLACRLLCPVGYCDPGNEG